ncbi:MAG: 3-oxoacyl-ACP reductase FabG [Chloroflexi bacterium]|nr:3-oxoacyl-ACP reductase FabG [Chloroflexota bacterium]
MKGKIAVVTGAGTGIGQGIALDFGLRGAKTVLHYHSHAEGALEVVRQIKEQGGEALAVRADLSRVPECRRLIDACVAAYGGIDILICNSGISTQASVVEMTEEAWDLTFNVNLKGAFFCAQAAVRQMIPRGGGKIVFLGSVHGHYSMPNHAAYSATKGGLEGLTRQMAFELARKHINVNLIAPGVIEVDRYFETNPDYATAKYAKMVPVGRVGYPADVAKAAAFLVSDDAAFITGQILYVDGGQTTPLALLPGLTRALAE